MDPRTPTIQSWALQQARQVEAQKARTQSTIWTLFAGWFLSRWYDTPAAMQPTIQQATDLVEHSRAIAGNLGIAYAAEVAAGVVGARIRPINLQLPAARRGADLRLVYSRPVEAFRREYSRTGDETSARAAARARLDQLVEMDLTLARRDGEHQGLGLSGDQAGNLTTTTGDEVEILGYRRIVHPELSLGGVCGLCLAASDRLYRVAELLPIHARCKCTIAPVTTEYDPAEANEVDLEAIYAAAGGTTAGKELKKTRWTVNEHGEYGPVLSGADDTFQRAGDAPKGDPIARARAELAALEPVLARLEERAAAGEDVSGPLTWQQDRIARLREVLAA